MDSFQSVRDVGTCGRMALSSLSFLGRDPWQERERDYGCASGAMLWRERHTAEQEKVLSVLYGCVVWSTAGFVRAAFIGTQPHVCLCIVCVCFQTTKSRVVMTETI